MNSFIKTTVTRGSGFVLGAMGATGKARVSERCSVLATLKDQCQHIHVPVRGNVTEPFKFQPHCTGYLVNPLQSLD